MACGILVLRPGIKVTPLHWKHRVLTTGPPGKSPRTPEHLFLNIFIYFNWRVIVWQGCIGLCRASAWISRRSPLGPPSHPSHCPRLSQRLCVVPCVTQHIPTGWLFYIRWRVFLCHSFLWWCWALEKNYIKSKAIMLVVEMFAFDMGRGLHIYYFKNHTSLLAFVFLLH